VKRLKHFSVLHFVSLQWQVSELTGATFNQLYFIIAAGLGNAVSDVMGIG
jgi:hypothetical protein